MTPNEEAIFQECADIALEHIEDGGLDDPEIYVQGYDQACRDIAEAIRLRASNRKTMDAIADAKVVDLQREKAEQRDMWVHGFNSCLHTAIQALNYLSSHPRPEGGQSAYNSEHLLQIADEIKRTIAHNIALLKP